MSTAVEDVVVTATRVWAVPDPDPEDTTSQAGDAAESQRVRRRYPAEALIFDTETRDEASQRLMVGVWRYYSDDPVLGQVGRTCIAEGFFYPDDLPHRDPAGWAVLQGYVAEHPAEVAPGWGPGLQLIPESEWLDTWLHTRAVRHRARCDIVGFNLPFDFGALALRWGPGRGRHRGGWSLGLWGRFDPGGRWQDRPYRRRLLLRSIDPRRTLSAWGPTWGPKGKPPDPDQTDPYGWRFVDLRTLAFALTDRSHTLETACAAFGDPFGKSDVDYGLISTDLLAYALDDVRHTATLYRNCVTELRRHPGVALRPSSLYSPAGVGAGYLRAMGVTPPLQKYNNLDPKFLGWAMSAFYGGRAEARIVRTPVPVVVADFTSMYPAINGLLGTWPLLNAADVTVEDVTATVRELLADPELRARLFDPATWRDAIGVTLVQIQDPDGVMLPTRAGYDPQSTDFGIGLNPLHYHGTLWYALPDVVAAALHNSAPIRIRRALRLQPHGTQGGLRKVPLRGTVTVDPREDRNPFVVMIEERQRIKRDASLPAEERDRLDQFLKITANATAYGSLARFDRTDLADPVGVTVYGPGDEPFLDRTSHPEAPGPYCFPPLAASITAGARLMLALIETAVTDAGGAYAFMDTDSIGIVATPTGDDVPCVTSSGDSIRTLSHDRVREILRTFEPLNPYAADIVNNDPALGRSPWKIEHDSLTNNIWCYAIATKRYALYTPSRTGPQLVQAADGHEEAHDSHHTPATEDAGDLTDWSEHALGMYLDPTDAAGTNQSRENTGRRTWIRDAWQWILTKELTGTNPPLPPWADRPAVTQFSVSTPNHARWFRLDTDTHTPGKPRPFGFGLLAHIDPPAQDKLRQAGVTATGPAAPFDRDPSRWIQLSWYDRHTGDLVQVAPADTLGQDPVRLAAALSTGDPLPLRTIASVIRNHPYRIEHKSDAPDGTCTTTHTGGQLQRRAIRSASVLTSLIGKEGNRLLERATGEIIDPAGYRTTYSDPANDSWLRLVLPVLREIRDVLGAQNLANQLKISGRQLRNWLTGRNTPYAGSSQNRQRVETYVLDWARQQLQASGQPVPADTDAALYAYLTAWSPEPVQTRFCR